MVLSEERVWRKRLYFAPRHLQLRTLASSNERVLVKLFRTGICRLRLEVPGTLVWLAARAEEVLFLAARGLRFDSDGFVFNVLHGWIRPWAFISLLSAQLVNFKNFNVLVLGRLLSFKVIRFIHFELLLSKLICICCKLAVLYVFSHCGLFVVIHGWTGVAPHGCYSRSASHEISHLFVVDESHSDQMGLSIYGSRLW